MPNNTLQGFLLGWREVGYIERSAQGLQPGLDVCGQQTVKYPNRVNPERQDSEDKESCCGKLGSIAIVLFDEILLTRDSSSHHIEPPVSRSIGV